MKSPYEEVTTAETDILLRRIDVMQSFVNSPAFDALSTFEKTSMLEQWSLQMKLLDCLRARLAYWRSQPDPAPAEPGA